MVYRPIVPLLGRLKQDACNSRPARLSRKILSQKRTDLKTTTKHTPQPAKAHQFNVLIPTSTKAV